MPTDESKLKSSLRKAECRRPNFRLENTKLAFNMTLQAPLKAQLNYAKKLQSEHLTRYTAKYLAMSQDL